MNRQTIQNISEDIQGIKQTCDNTEGSRTDIYVNLYVLYSGHPSLDGKGELLSDNLDGQYYATVSVRFANSIKSEHGKLRSSVPSTVSWRRSSPKLH